MDFDAFRLAASTADLTEEPAARAHADLVEFRMDLAESPEEALAGYDGELPLLVTNRAEWEGGDAGEEGRIEALCAAVEHASVEAVDVELAEIAGGDGLDVVEAARANDARVVVSVHDFEGTPQREELSRLLTRAGEYGDVAKLAVTATSRADVLHLLGVTYAHTAQGDSVATMAMGEPGRHSRAVAPLYGSRIGYAPVAPERATAPGQYDLETLADLVARLESRPESQRD
jgi:3-dehydroquinate dehydratase-1